MKQGIGERINAGISQGDAYGQAYEFLGRGRKNEKDLDRVQLVLDSLDYTKYSKNPNIGYPAIAAHYTDDTQQSLAIEELLLSNKPLTSNNFADYFVKVYKRNPFQGYSRRMQAFLEEVQNGKEFRERIIATGTTNGSCMRAIPLGIQKNIDMVRVTSSIQSQLTHNTYPAIAGAVFISLTSHLLIHTTTPMSQVIYQASELIRYIDQSVANHIQKTAKLKSLDRNILYGKKYLRTGIPSQAKETVGAVAYILTNYEGSSNNILKESVKLGGDTDSVASLCLGLHAIRYPLDDLPEFLHRDLINHKYGRDYLAEIGQRLEQKFLKE